MRNCDRNMGFIALPYADEDKWIVGSVIVLLDDSGNTYTRWHAESWDWVPDIPLQECLGAHVAEAFRTAQFQPEPDIDAFLRECLP